MSSSQIVSTNTGRFGTGRSSTKRVPLNVDGDGGIASGKTTTDNSLDTSILSDVSDDVPHQTIRTRKDKRRRNKWTIEMNIFIMRKYYEITDVERDVSNYRTQLYTEFKSKYPNMNITIQNIADQRRAIVKHNYLPHTTLERLKNDITRNFSHYNSPHPQNNSDHTSANNSVNTLTLDPPSHHDDISHQTFEPSVHNDHSINITPDLSP